MSLQFPYKTFGVGEAPPPNPRTTQALVDVAFNGNCSAPELLKGKHILLALDLHMKRQNLTVVS